MPDGWEAGPSRRDRSVVQPDGPRLGYQGPDQGYALALAARVRPKLVLSDSERADDALTGCTAVAMRRASMFGRAPVIHDLHIAFTIWGFVDPAPPAELVALRRPLFEGAAEPEHYAIGAPDRRHGARRHAGDDAGRRCRRPTPSAGATWSAPT